MKDGSLVRQYYELWVLLHQTRDAVYKAREKELRPYTVSPEQVAVLNTVQAIGNAATPAEISRWLFRESHSVSGILSRMQKQGLVRRVKDLDKKNLVRVEITERGQQILSQSTKREVINRIMSTLSPQECQQLRSCLDKLLGKALMELGMERKLVFP